MSKPDPKQTPAHVHATTRDWTAYFDRTAGMPPRETLIDALDAFGEIDPANPPLAVDLGCGIGRDTGELLSRGWRVIAQDSSTEGLERIRTDPVFSAAIGTGRLQIMECAFEDFTPPPCDLLNASFSLPFCPPPCFEDFWLRIDHAIRPGGYFCGQLFGDRDDWSILEDRTHLTREQALSRFQNYVLHSFREEDRPSNHTGEAHKHWHIFHIIARKRIQ
ncbi:MAG: class I SAM-dependent methyltransferase [Phycisphaerales bacterium]|nr:class I SAM-dependent methyltransferase [Phycisphaerales bacterium]